MDHPLPFDSIKMEIFVMDIITNWNIKAKQLGLINSPTESHLTRHSWLTQLSWMIPVKALFHSLVLILHLVAQSTSSAYSNWKWTIMHFINFTQIFCQFSEYDYDYVSNFYSFFVYSMFYLWHIPYKWSEMSAIQIFLGHRSHFDQVISLSLTSGSSGQLECDQTTLRAVTF